MRAAFEAGVRPELRDWPARTAANPARLAAGFASAGRACGRADLAGLAGWTRDDAARVLLLHAAARGRDGGPAPVDPTALVRALYDRGDPCERRAVLRALPYLPDVDPASARDLVEDALRTNDHRLIAAAMGPCARVLDADAWRHGVLKCLFVGLPPTPTVADLDQRADAELARMLRELGRERTAAGRPSPTGIEPIATAFAP
ncbi:EboA domain-containing protein (plasmid) [Embleya sp. NBC_00888]|nr:EboA domain-containing protein [Embleya sp. NBC_00888]